MKALKCTGVEQAEVQSVPLPELRDTYVLVKVNAVALNPTDWFVWQQSRDLSNVGRKHITLPALATPGCTVGCDFAGTVVDVGSKVTKSWKKGDRICGMTHGVNKVEPEDGSFAEYAVAKGDIFIKTPDNLTDEEAATLGVGISTVGQGLYQSLGLPLPGQGTYDKYLLVYGGR